MAEVATFPTETTASPGEDARQSLALAGEYHAAAKALRAHVRRGEPLSGAPFRFACLHAIELYLGAFLRLHGLCDGDLRKTGHQFCAKAALAVGHGLVLRAGTLGHLVEMTGRGEYRHMRYDPLALAQQVSPVNRLEATLDEVAAKVGKAFEAE